MALSSNIPPITESSCFRKNQSAQDKISIFRNLLLQIERADELTIGGVRIIKDGTPLFEDVKSLILERLNAELESFKASMSAMEML